jgi:two-component system sensor histidine kinase VicK
MRAVTTESEVISFLQGGGEMGKLIRSKDWKRTPLGDLSQWPQSLRTTLSIILNSKFPMFLFWGPQLICFYNDAYRPSLGNNGKHPSILGIPAVEAWAEIWHIIKPLIDQVMAGGEATWSEDQLIPIYRNGKIEDVYWTFSYSPVNDESGKVAGVFVTCTETTSKVIGMKLTIESEKNFRNLVMKAPVPTAVFKGPEFIIELANDEVLKLWGKDKAILGKKIIEALPELEGQPFIKLMEEVYTTGIAYEGKENIAHVDQNGEIKTVYFNLVYKALYDSDGTINGLLCMGNDVTEQVMARKKVEDSEKKFKTLSSFMPQHIWTSDAEGRLNFYNESVYRFTGLNAAETNPSDWLEIVHPDDREENMKVWKESIEAGVPFLFEHRFRRYDGEYRWQLSRALPVKDDNGTIQMWVGTSTDIDELKKHEQQKDDFIKMASHELKTPVTTIKGYVQLLLNIYNNSKDGVLTSSLSNIDKQVSKLTKLITDLLDVTKIETGSFRLNKENFIIDDLITDIANDLKATFASHVIKPELQPGISIHADRDRISQVLLNLLANAIKYSPNGEKVVVKTQATADELIVCVQDFGIGIAPGDHEKIFERFYRVEGKDEKTFPGFGIGLFIVKEIISLHQGKVWVESEKNAGSSFYFSLPR